MTAGAAAPDVRATVEEASKLLRTLTTPGGFWVPLSMREAARTVLTERNALAARVAELEGEREADVRAVAEACSDFGTDEGPRGIRQLYARFADRIAALAAKPEVVIGAGSPETSALTHCPTCGSPEWLDDGRRGWNPVDVECEVCAGTYDDDALAGDETDRSGT